MLCARSIGSLLTQHRSSHLPKNRRQQKSQVCSERECQDKCRQRNSLKILETYYVNSQKYLSLFFFTGSKHWHANSTACVIQSSSISPLVTGILLRRKEGNILKNSPWQNGSFLARRLQILHQSKSATVSQEHGCQRDVRAERSGIQAIVFSQSEGKFSVRY